LREITPKDFYFAQILRNQELSFLPLVLRLVRNDEELDNIPAKYFRSSTNWIVETLLKDNILTVENWLEVAFHLCKQRWDSSIDWMETLPMSKIQAMIQITKSFAESQEDQMKKAARRKK